MPERVTNFEIDTFEIREDHYARLPGKVREMLRWYAEPVAATRAGYQRYRMAQYRWEEINAALEQVEAYP